MSSVMSFARSRLELPAVQWADCLLRLPLAAIILQQASYKLPLNAEDAAAYGLPVLLWGLAAFGELAAGAGLLVGGLIRNWFGDAVTRLAGLGIAIIVAGVLVVAYAAPPTVEILLYNQLHVMLLVSAVFFALRGNRA